MMSLKPRAVDFQETWANLKETVAGVVALRAVERAVWNTRFSDVYALCVAHPEPMAEKLLLETRNFLEEHVAGLLERVRGDTNLDSDDHTDGLMTRYVSAWREFSQGISYLNSLYSYLNLQHVKRQKLCDAEIIYGTAATVNNPEQDYRQLEVGELGLMLWERVLLRPIASGLSRRIVSALAAARESPLDPTQSDLLRHCIHSTVHVQTFRIRNPLGVYQELVLTPYLEWGRRQHAALAAQLLQGNDLSHYMRCVLQGLEKEIDLASRYLHSSSLESVRACYEQAAVATHVDTLHAHCGKLLAEASEDGPESKERRADLRRMFILLQPLGGAALRPLVDAAHAHVAREGQERLHSNSAQLPEEAHTHFVTSMLQLHAKYTALFADVFNGAQVFVGALDKACSSVVNSRPSPEQPARAPELLARYCDLLLRKKGGGNNTKESGDTCDVDDKLANAIVVFKYVDDKDVFQKFYSRALARRLIHQLSASMEQEEAMINRLKAACGYEFTNKLHRMFTDVQVSVDLNAKFQQHLRDTGNTVGSGFNVQVLQAGAWPLGGAMAPLAPPVQLEQPARMFEAFYRDMFSGRRLAWLHHLCAGELRTRYTARMYHVCATTPQCALLLCFETIDSAPAKELRDTLQLTGESWARNLTPLIDAGLLLAEGDVESEEGEGVLTLNLNFSCKRTKVRVSCANAPNQHAIQPSTPLLDRKICVSPNTQAETEANHCDDDRKMYLQAALVRIMKQRKVLRHTDLIQEVVSQARGSFAPSVGMIKKCIEALIDKQYLERAPGAIDTYSYLA